MRCIFSIVFLQNLQCLLDTVDPLLHLCTVFRIGGVLLRSQFIRFCLCRCHASKFLLKCGCLLLELCRRCLVLCDLRGEFVARGCQLVPLCRCRRCFLIAPSFLCSIGFTIRLQGCDHVCDQSFHFRK